MHQEKPVDPEVAARIAKREKDRAWKDAAVKRANDKVNEKIRKHGYPEREN